MQDKRDLQNPIKEGITMKFFKVIAKIFAVIAGLFGLTFTIYWFNLDMKLVNKVYFLLQKHYDTMKRDKRL